MSDVLSCASPVDRESWLSANWQRPNGVWLKIAKKGSRVASVTVSEALDRDGRAKAAFESLGRTERYAVVLPLLKARTPQQRAERLRAAMARLRAGRQAP